MPSSARQLNQKLGKNGDVAGCYTNLTDGPMPVAFLLSVINYLMPITQLDQQPSKFRDHTQAVCSMSSPSTPAAPLLVLTRFHAACMVLSCQRLLQQATSACLRLCRPCARVFSKRVAGFVADEITHSLTVRYAHPPGLFRHLTPCL